MPHVCSDNAATDTAVQRSELLKLKGQLHAVEDAVAQERVALSSQHQSQSQMLVRRLDQLCITSILCIARNTELGASTM